jgi:hypothetical protein
MELFCALLTGFFLWLFLFHWRYSARERARRLAGALLIERRPTDRVVHKTRQMRIVYSALTLLAFLWLWYFVIRRSSWTFQFDIIVAVFSFAILKELFPSFRRDAPVELRENGVVRCAQSYENRPGCLAFTPWDEIAGCKWCDGLPKHYIRTRHLLLERNGLTQAEVDAITAVAKRFVRIFDADGKLLAGPEPAVETSDAPLRPQRSGGLRFQFSLQSLMLLMVVVSCAASCYGIRDRRIQPQLEAASKLETFHPRRTVLFDNVKLLDFSACATKPTDDDLASLEPLVELEDLDLTGATVTDAGLRHLYPLKRLEFVTLRDTRVTKKGVDELKRALPHTNVYWHPPPAPAAPPPTKKP